MYNVYIYPFLFSFLVSAFLTAVIILFSKRFGLEREMRHSKKNSKLSRFGGAAIILSFLIALAANDNLVFSAHLLGFAAASVIILLVGIWDDISNLSWKMQFLFQVAVASLVFIMGIRVEYITNPLGGVIFLEKEGNFILSLVFIIFWIVLMVNSMNWIDGIDGLSGGISLIGLITIFFLILKPEVNQPPMGIMAALLSGALLGFLIFNFYPARIIAGTSGSAFMGFALATFAIFSGTKIATALLIMIIPIVDSIWVVFERLKEGKSIFSPDRKHLHYKLAELGWGSKRIALLFYSLTALIAFIALNTRTLGKILTLALVAAVTIFFIIFVNKKIKKEEQKI